MKKITIAVLALALCAAFPVHARTETAVIVKTVAFDRLPALVTAGNPGYLKDLQEIRGLELSISEMESTLKKLNLNWSVSIDAILEVQANLSHAEALLKDAKDTLAAKAQVRTHPVRMLYLNHYVLAAEIEVAQRDLAALEKELSNGRLKLSRGLIAQNAVTSLEKNVKIQQDALKAAQTKADDNRKALAGALGLSGDVAPDGLPAMDFKRITDRDIDADRAAYISAASAGAEKAKKEARWLAEKTRLSADWYASSAADKDFEKAKKDAETAFPKVYQTLRDALDAMMESTALADAQKAYGDAQTQFARGLLSQNRFLDAHRTLENAKSRAKQQEIRVWQALLEYECNLNKH